MDGMNESGIVFVRFRLVSDRYDRSVEVKQLRTTISSDMTFVGSRVGGRCLLDGRGGGRKRRGLL
jgi:hypothetical protein